MAKRQTPIVIHPPTEVPTWDQLPLAARQSLLGLVGKAVRRLESQGLQVWLPAGEGVPVND